MKTFSDVFLMVKNPHIIMFNDLTILNLKFKIFENVGVVYSFFDKYIL